MERRRNTPSISQNPKLPGEPRLELGGVGAALREKLNEVYSHAQMTMERTTPTEEMISEKSPWRTI